MIRRMMMMKWACVGLALVAACTGLVAAVYWYRSSRVPITPTWTTEPGETGEAQMGWTVGTMKAFCLSSRLNAKAAIWTAVSVGLAAVSSIVGIWA
jgi:hypothetical protein